MDPKRPYQDEDQEPGANYPKRLKTFNSHPDGGIHTSHDAYPSLTYRDYTIAWICALSLELAASRAMLDELHQPLPGQVGDDNTYVLGRIHQHNVVMVCLPGQYGTNNAAIVATNLKRSFPEIRATLMVGIGGGSPSQADLYLGDVVVGTRVMQYDMGKVVTGGCFEETAIPKTPALLLNSAVSALRSNHGPNRSCNQLPSLLRSQLPELSRPNHDRLFQASYEHSRGAPTCDSCDLERLQSRGERLLKEPKVHYGVIASGNKVIKDGKTRDDIARRFSALCFEMEAAGMMDNLQCLPIRGICDYSDSHKNKDWQDYAAATAAAYARELLEVLPPSSGQSGATCLNRANKPSTADDQVLARRQRLVESLNFPQVDARKTSIGAAHAKTCRWLVRLPIYQDWLDPAMQSHHCGFLWMRGKAGAGKSTMMKFLYLESKRSDGPHATTASFFFNARGDYLEKSITGMYRSLLIQLFHKFSDIQVVLDNTDIVPWSQQDCPGLNALKELIRSAVIALGQRSFACFIDALDECDEQEVRDMVQFFDDLAEHTTENGIRFRICFSSRPYPYISIRKGMSLVLESESGHADDLAQYVNSNLKIEDSVLLADLKTGILDKAAGIFLWIVLVVDILNKEDDNGGLALRKKLSQIPAKLSDLFKSILMRDQREPERLLICVLWILCAKRPLTPAEFRHALWVGLLGELSENKDHEVDSELPEVGDMNVCAKLVTSSSKGLAEITKTKTPTVQFIHESVRDFLIKEKGLQHLWPNLQFNWEGASHEKLKHYCNTYLQLPGVSMIFDRSAGEDKPRGLVEKYPLLEYVSQHVLHHADAATPAKSQNDFLSQFFASAGIRVLNLLERRQNRRYTAKATPLYVLADKGLENLIRTRMQRESATRSPAESYQFPLFAALANGHKGAVAALLGLHSVTCDGIDITEGLKYRKDVNDSRNRTPLSWAAQNGRLSMVEALAQGGADINERDTRGYTPLIRASANGHETVARFLIDEGADVSACNNLAIMEASRHGQEAMVRLLIDKGADINAQDTAKATTLIKASRWGHEAVVRLLIEKGADVSARNNLAIMEASRHGHEVVVRLLIEKGADVSAQNNHGETALIQALRCGNEALVRLLIDKGSDISARNSYEQTALMKASYWGHEDAVRLLIDKGSDISAQNNHGETALIQASRCGHEALVRLLIDKGSDISARNSYGQTALMYASHWGHEDAVRLLIDKGSDISARNTYGETALFAASRYGHKAVVRLLIDKGSDINARNNHGETALTGASRYGQKAVVRLLIEKGADVSNRDSLAVIEASRHRHMAVVQLHIDKGADISAED